MSSGLNADSLGFHFPHDSHKDGLPTPVDDASADTTPQRDELFYCEYVVIQVENTLFNIPRSCLSFNSGAFDTMWTLPQDDNQPKEGNSDQTPVVLQGATVGEFKSLLKVLLPFRFSDMSTIRQKVSNDDWISILKLSSQWDFSDIRMEAIRMLTGRTIPAIDKLLLAHRYDIDAWIVPALDALAKQDFLEETDVTQIIKMVGLGLPYLMKLCRVREAFYLPSSWSSQSDELGCNYVSSHNAGCTSCGQSYRCASNCHHGAAIDRSQHDFTALIRFVFELSD